MQGRLGIAAALMLVQLAGCGGSGSSSSSPPPVTPPSDGQSYFIDATAGDDGNAGTSQGSPWKTLARIAQTKFDKPTTLYLKRGDVWHEGLTVPAPDFSIGPYGTGTDPVLDGSVSVPAWGDLGGGLYSAGLTLTTGQGLGNLADGSTYLNFLPWLGSSSATFSGAATGSYSYDYASSTLYLLPATRPKPNEYSASVILVGITATGLKDVSVKDVTVRRMSLHGVEFTDCTDCSEGFSTLSGIGGAVIGPDPSNPGQYLYAGNGIQFGNDSSGSVRDVTVSDVFDSCVTAQTYESDAKASGLSFSGLNLARCGFAGVELSVLSNGGTTGSSLNDVTVSAALISDTGRGWSGQRYGSEGEGVRIEADAGAGVMSGVTVSTTTVTDAISDGVRLAGEVGTVSLNRLQLAHNVRYGVSVLEPNAASLLLDLRASIVNNNGSYGVIFNAPHAAGLRLYQDTFYDNGSIDVGIQAQAGVADIRNNLFFSDTAITDLYSAAALQGVTLDNDCYNDSANMIGYNGSAYSSVASFNGATSLEAHGKGTGTVGLQDPVTGEFQLTAGSACLGLGDPTVGVLLDFSGAAYLNPPASGAYQ